MGAATMDTAVFDLLVGRGYLRRCPSHHDVVIDEGVGGSVEAIAAEIPFAERVRFQSREDLECAIRAAIVLADESCSLCRPAFVG